MAATRLAFLAVLTATFATPTVTFAGHPVELTNNQLDRVTAGAVTVTGSADAQAAGVLALTGTGTTSYAVQGASPVKGQPGYATSAGESSGVAVAVGTNLAAQNQPPPSSSTSVMTGGTASGNVVFNTTSNQTMHGAGGVTVQIGYTFVYGAVVFGL